jgi:(p)ppGpp synthase/HD superfamily hydrolase
MSTGTRAPSTTYQVEVLIEAIDRTRLLQDVSIVLAGRRCERPLGGYLHRSAGRGYLRFLLELGSVNQLQRVLSASGA